MKLTLEAITAKIKAGEQVTNEELTQYKTAVDDEQRAVQLAQEQKELRRDTEKAVALSRAVPDEVKVQFPDLFPYFKR